jgi:hypothetical protein
MLPQTVRLRKNKLGFGGLAEKHVKLHCTRVMGCILSLSSKSGLQCSESILFYKFDPQLQLSNVSGTHVKMTPGEAKFVKSGNLSPYTGFSNCKRTHCERS